MNGQQQQPYLTPSKSAPLNYNGTTTTTFHGHATDDSCNSSRSESPNGKIQLPEAPVYPGYSSGLGYQQNYR